MNDPRLVLVFALCLGFTAPLSAQLKTFQSGEPARASEVNQNFQVVKKAADDAAAEAAKLKNRADLTGAHVVDESLEAADIKPNIVSSIGGITNDGGDVDIVAGKDITVTKDAAGKKITIGSKWTGGSVQSSAHPIVTLTSTNLTNSTFGTLQVESAGMRAIRALAGIDPANQFDTTAIEGVATSQNNKQATGVQGFARSATGSTGTLYGGLFHAGNSSRSNPAYGLVATAQGRSPGACIGVAADTLCQLGPTTGVRASSWTNATVATGYSRAVHGSAVAKNGPATGVHGDGNSTDGTSYGVFGTASSTSSTATAYGVYGQNTVTGTNRFGVYSAGKFGATSNKSFIHPHPKNPKKVVEFVCLEGNENGTYFRGKARLRGGRATLEIPEAWKLVTAEEGITVNLTPIRSLARIAVWEMTRDKITVRGDADCEFSYMVNGVRRGFEKHEPVRENSDFRPELAGVPFGQQYPKAYRDLLVENGLLNTDYTPNARTADKLGWKLRKPTQREIQRAWLREMLWRRAQAQEVR